MIISVTFFPVYSGSHERQVLTSIVRRWHGVSLPARLTPSTYLARMLHYPGYKNNSIPFHCTNGVWYNICSVFEKSVCILNVQLGTANVATLTFSLIKACMVTVCVRTVIACVITWTDYILQYIFSTFFVILQLKSTDIPTVFCLSFPPVILGMSVQTVLLYITS